jgi:hypothetical protein
MNSVLIRLHSETLLEKGEEGRKKGGGKEKKEGKRRKERREGERKWQ